MKPQLAAGCYPPLDNYDADIIILTVDRFAETVDAVRSALTQSNVSHHVIVLDQGSTAANRTRFIAAFDAMPNLAFFTIDTNLGVGGGRNILAACGHGKVIIALDNDATFEDNTVAARAVAAFKLNPQLGALGFRILARDGVKLDEFSWGYPASLKSRYQDSFDTTTFVGAGHAIRRATWDEAGGYDATLFFTWEEYDFCLAAIARQWIIRYDGSLGVIHKIAPEARIGWSAARIRYFVRNRLIIARKWGTTWPRLAPRMIGYMIKGLLNARLGATLAGIYEAIQNDPPRRQRVPPAMKNYCFENETRYRGSLWQRLRFELFSGINSDPQG